MCSNSLACQVVFLKFTLGGKWQAPLMQFLSLHKMGGWLVSFLHNDSSKGLDVRPVSCLQLGGPFISSNQITEGTD